MGSWDWRWLTSLDISGWLFLQAWTGTAKDWAALGGDWMAFLFNSKCVWSESAWYLMRIDGWLLSWTLLLLLLWIQFLDFISFVAKKKRRKTGNSSCLGLCDNFSKQLLPINYICFEVSSSVQAWRQKILSQANESLEICYWTSYSGHWEFEFHICCGETTEKKKKLLLIFYLETGVNPNDLSFFLLY